MARGSRLSPAASSRRGRGRFTRGFVQFLRVLVMLVIGWHVCPAVAVDYDDFPPELQGILNERIAALTASGGICLAGKVTLSDGACIGSGADVQVNLHQNIDGPTRMYPDGWFIMARTASRFHSGTNKHVVVRAFGYDPIDAYITILADQMTYLDFHMMKTPPANLASVYGTVTDEDGHPFCGARVMICFPPANYGYNSQGYSYPHMELTTGPNGTYAFESLSPCEHRLTTLAPGYAYHTKTFTPPPGGTVLEHRRVYADRRIVLEYVYPPDGSRSLTQGSPQKEQISRLNVSTEGNFSQGKVAKSLAVLDFTMKQGITDNVENWTVGLAEFMTAALQERGIATLERRDLRYVLSERRLRSQGLVKPSDVIRSQLPWVRYLLAGEITPQAADQFELSISVLDAQDGHEVLRESAAGVYPTELARGIADLAGKVAGALEKAEEPLSPSPAPRLGFTRTPEIALHFYKGLDWLIGGRPEFAEQYFRQAIDMDKTFHVARLWRMKAYRSLGLDDFAQTVHDELAQDAVGRALLESLGSGTRDNNTQTVVSIVAPPGVEHRDAQLEDALARALIKERTVRVFRPRRIHELADESDLELTGEFEDRILSDGLILAADVLISVGSTSGTPVPEPSVQMTLIDAVAGEVQATGSRSCAATSSEACCAELFRELFARRGVSASAPQATFGVQPPDYGPWSPISGLGRDVQQYAYYLRALAAAPKDRHTLMAFLAAQDRLCGGRVRREEAAIEEVLARRLLNLIDDQEPDAANWLSQALWILVRSKKYLKPSGSYNSVPKDLVEQTLQPLVARHPASLAAFYAQYHIALERAAAGKHKEAADLLVRLAERLPEFGAHEWPKTFKANLFFFAAYEANLVGELEQARRFITAAEDEISPWDANMRALGNFAHVGVVHPAFSHCRWGDNGLVLFHPKDTWLQTFSQGRIMCRLPLPERKVGQRARTLVQEIAALRETISGESRAPSLRDQFSRAQDTAGREGVAARLEFLKNFTDFVRRGEPRDDDQILFDAIAFVQWLADLMPLDQIPRLYQMARDLADALEARQELYHPDLRLRFRLYMAAAMYADARELADRMLSASKEERERYFAVLAKARILLETDTLDHVARFLDDELRRFERDIPAPYTRHSNLTMKCAWAYRTTGQLAEAARVYQRGIDAPVLHPDSEQARQDKASLLFELAGIREQEGKTDEAATLFKQVIEACEGQQWGLNSGGELLDRITLGQQAIERLERLRGERTELTPVRFGAPVSELLHHADGNIAMGDLPVGIEFLYIVLYRLKGFRSASEGGFNSDEDWSLAARAEARLEELRVPSGP